MCLFLPSRSNLNALPFHECVVIELPRADPVCLLSLTLFLSEGCLCPSGALRKTRLTPQQQHQQLQTLPLHTNLYVYTHVFPPAAPTSDAAPDTQVHHTIPLSHGSELIAFDLAFCHTDPRSVIFDHPTAIALFAAHERTSGADIALNSPTQPYACALGCGCAWMEALGCAAPYTEETVLPELTGGVTRDSDS